MNAPPDRVFPSRVMALVALLGVLSAETRQALEGDLKSLVEGLENPDTLDVKVSGDHAVVEVPGGHQVKLRREAGVWHVQDFD